MTFDLINIGPFVFGFIVIAGLTGLLAVVALMDFFTSNRKVRIERHASIPAYYGSLLGAH